MMNLVPSMTISDVSTFLYPRVYQITDLRADSNEPIFAFPPPLRASIEYFNQKDAYFIENGLIAFIWIGQEIKQEWLSNVFNVNSFQQLDSEKVFS